MPGDFHVGVLEDVVLQKPHQVPRPRSHLVPLRRQLLGDCLVRCCNTPT